MAERAPAVVRSLFGAYGLAVVAALLAALGVLGGKLYAGWERDRARFEQTVQALRQEVIDYKVRVIVLEVQQGELRDDVRQRALHDRDQWRSIEALERRRR
jgi:sugar phosphate isomerase/epimerase